MSSATTTPRSGCALAALVGILVGCGGGVPVDPDLGQGKQSVTICPAADTVLGLDVSQWQGTVDWSEVAAAGKAFGFIRATYGSTGIDNRFAANWPAARAAGLVRGPYHLLAPEADAVAQAELFLGQLELAGGLLADDLPPVLYVEEMGGQSAAAVVAGIQSWLDYVQDAIGRRPVIYTAASLWDGNQLGGSVSSYPLWVASYGVACPLTPDAWSQGWTFWQNSSTGTCPGISGGVNLDVFDGTLDELGQFIVDSNPSQQLGTIQGVVHAGTNVDERITPALVTIETGLSVLYSDPTSTWSFEVEPGTYTITATAAGYLPGATTQTVAAGETVWAGISLQALPDGGSPEDGGGEPPDGGSVDAGAVSLDAAFFDDAGTQDAGAPQDAAIARDGALEEKDAAAYETDAGPVADAAVLGPGPTPPDQDGGSEGVGCGTSGPTCEAWVLFGLLGLLRRRR